MPRNPYAAAVLDAEVKALFPDATMEPFGEPDGLGVHRSFRFDKDTSTELVDALHFLADRRVSSVNITDAGYLHVEFVGDSFRADSRDPFMVKIALDVLAHPDEFAEDFSSSSE